MPSSKSKTEQPTKKYTLSEAASEYYVSLKPEDRVKSQPEVTKFVRWYGENRLISELKAQEIEDYAERLTTTITDVAEKIDPVKAFLSFSFKKGFIQVKLAPHIKFKKMPSKVTYSYKLPGQKSMSLTPQGFADLENELKELIAQRPKMTEDIHKAAADKDFRENAPLQAAKEHAGKVEGKIKELEAILKTATVLTDKHDSSSQIALIGYTLVLKDLTVGEKVTYMLVDIKEANPSLGKISVKSPIGKALVGHKVGERVEVIAPAGILPYEIINIKHT
jgi:transcription elongation factor GreA